MKKIAILGLAVLLAGCLGQPAQNTTTELPKLEIDKFMQVSSIELNGVKGGGVLPIVPENFADSVKLRTAVWDFTGKDVKGDSGVVFIVASYPNETAAHDKVTGVVDSIDITQQVFPPITKGSKTIEGIDVSIVQIGDTDTSYFWSLGDYVFLARQAGKDKFVLDQLVPETKKIFDQL